MLSQQEGQEHQHASVMDNPPHIYVSFSEALSIGRVAGDILRNQQGQTGYSCLSNHLCRGTNNNGYRLPPLVLVTPLDRKGVKFMKTKQK